MPTPTPSSETTAVDLAEQARLALDPARAHELLGDIVSNYTIEQILKLDSLQLTNFLRGLRIRINVLGQEFAARPLAAFALPYLRQVVVLLNYYYSSPELQALAATIETDPHGSEYAMLAEMWRDVASYCLKAAVLTGDEQFLREAQAAYLKAVESSKPETNVQPLAKFEALVAAHKAGMPISLQSLSEQWQNIITRTDNHDRIAKVSWEMMQVARKLGNTELELQARQLCREHASYLPGGYLKYAARQIVRSKIIAPIQHATYVGAGDDLELATALAQQLNISSAKDTNQTT